jgi:XTP/dITP diphosphohydrolase
LILYLASRNRGKLREFREGALGVGITIETIPGFQDLPPCREDGATFEENARKKALHYSAYVDERVFADDSGISVDALAGAPGVYSARFASLATASGKFRGSRGAGFAADPALSSPARDIDSDFSTFDVDAANNARLIRELKEVPLERRTAHYICVIVLAQRGRVLTITEGQADGLIADAPSGSGGFGYDPYFFYPTLGKTFAQLSPEEKFAVSHRGEAFRKLLNYLAGKREHEP